MLSLFVQDKLLDSFLEAQITSISMLVTKVEPSWSLGLRIGYL